MGKREEILVLLGAGKITPQEAGKQLDALDNAGRGLYCKVAEKTGAVSLYGLNSSWPVTLYAGQWERLLAGCPEDHVVLAFIKEWDGKEWTGTKNVGTGKEQHKVEYKARIARK